MPTLEEYGKIVQETCCRWCGEKLDTSAVEGYPHDGGWTVDGFKDKQWLYIHCTKCNYDWALWKLGVPRE